MLLILAYLNELLFSLHFILHSRCLIGCMYIFNHRHWASVLFVAKWHSCMHRGESVPCSCPGEKTRLLVFFPLINMLCPYTQWMKQTKVISMTLTPGWKNDYIKKPFIFQVRCGVFAVISVSVSHWFRSEMDLNSLCFFYWGFSIILGRYICLCLLWLNSEMPKPTQNFRDSRWIYEKLLWIQKLCVLY